MTALITEFQINQFGDGHPLRVLDLGNGLNVALARSDLGRDQLLNVIPYTLYGKFAVPARGKEGPAASAVLLRTDNGVFTVQRNWEDGNVRIIASDGSEFGKKKMRGLLDNVNFSKYRRVFTFTLARLAQFATGEDTAYLVEMADYLKRKSPTIPVPVPAPVTAVPELREVYSGLGQMTALLQQKADELNTPDEEEPRDRKKLSRDLKKVEAALADGRVRYEHLESELDETRAALSLNRAVKHLAAIDHELNRLETRGKKTDTDSATRNSLDRLVSKIDDCKLQLRQLKEEYNDVRRQVRDVTNHRRSPKSIAQVEAMLLHEKSLIKEDEAVEQLKLQAQDLEARIESERLNDSPSGHDSSRLSDSQTRTRIDDLADRLRTAERELELAEEHRLRAQSIPISSGSAALQPNVRPEDAVAVHEAEQVVLRLRDQLGLDDQLGQLELERNDLVMRIRHLYQNQLLPFPILIGLGIPFAIGTLLVIVGLFMSGGRTNWQFVMLGLAATIITMLVKTSLDSGSVERLDSARRRLAFVDSEMEQYAGTAALDATTGALQQELELAERRLAEMQSKFSSSIAPSTSPYSFADGPSVETAQLQLNQAHQRVRDLQHDWQQLLLQLGLPAALTPNKARDAIADRSIMSARSNQENDYQQWTAQLAQLQNEKDRRQEWLNTIGNQVRQLTKEMGLVSGMDSIPEQFDALRDSLREAREQSATKKQLSRSLKRIRQKREQIKENGRHFAEQHRRLLEEQKLKRERAKSQDSMGNERAKLLQEQRERLEREIEEIRERYRVESQSAITDQSDDELEQRLQLQSEKLEKLREKLLKHAEQRGRYRALLSVDAPTVEQDPREIFQSLQRHTQSLAEQLKATAKQAEADAQAQSLAASSQHQFEYLQRAGNYLADLSDGDFGRIELLQEAPGLGLVNEHGQLIPLDHVDRQHYPNLYFSLWLARLESYVDRGYHLPAIIEDPLVATKRARKPVVAELLRDFGIRGRQIIVVTASDSSADAYGRLGVPIADLSERQIVEDELPYSQSNGDSAAADAEPDSQEANDRTSFSPLG